VEDALEDDALEGETDLATGDGSGVEL